MADDQNQRPYRSSDVPARGNGGGNNTGSDPLAELARLIGQNDPFGEFGRDNGRRAPVSRAAEPGPEWPTDQATYHDEPSVSEGQRPPSAGYGRQTFGGAPLPAGGSQLYQVDAHAPGYDMPGYEAAAYPGATPGYEEAFPPSQEPLHDIHSQFGPAPEDDYYDDVPPASRRRISVLTIAGVFALAIIGTAGAFGYRAMFGSSSSTSPPPVIKAEQTPSKIVPAPPGRDGLAGKAITDRVSGQGERLVSREEQPVPVNAAPPVNSAFPPGSNTASTNAAAGSGIVGEPKKIRTIAIRPDGTSDASAAMPEPVPPAAPPARVTNVTPARQPAVAPQANPEPPRAAAPQPAPQPRQAAAPPPPVANAPLSLNPNAAPPARTAAVAAPARITPPTAAASAASTGGYAVQVSAQRSEAEAQAAFQAVQSKFPGQLGNRQPLIKRVDLGEKGIFYRAMVGPFGNSGEAGELCSSLKAAGGACIVQRN